MGNEPEYRPPVEPHADIRESAATSMQIYTAYLEVGFTELQALKITIAVLTVGIRGNNV